MSKIIDITERLKNKLNKNDITQTEYYKRNMNCIKSLEKMIFWTYDQTRTKLDNLLFDSCSKHKVPDGKVIDSTLISMNDKDINVIRSMTIDWMKNICKKSEPDANLTWLWFNLELGPKRTTRPSGYVYLSKKNMLKNPRGIY